MHWFKIILIVVFGTVMVIDFIRCGIELSRNDSKNSVGSFISGIFNLALLFGTIYYV